MQNGGCPAGSSRNRLDPFSLPVRFAASDAAADGAVREIEIHRERVVVRRSLAGMRMALNMPLSAYHGVALRVTPGEDDMGACIAVLLAHTDESLSLPLAVMSDADDAMADWRAWGNILGLPLLVEDENGFREPFTRMGQVRIASVKPRRRRSSGLKNRRPSILMRRAPGRLVPGTAVHRGEEEIIARR